VLEATTTVSGLPERPFMLLGQQSVADPTRAPDGQHTAWAYTHGPQSVDWAAERDRHVDRVEAQIERFAPGFGERILQRSVHTPQQLEIYNPNCLGGDINGGLQDLRQLFTRPAVRLLPYTTPDRSLYVCSSATPPGGGVHGIAGMLAAEIALRRAY
jgi:phytoene dehydrogenase-like protein